MSDDPVDLCPTCGAWGYKACSTEDESDHPGRPQALPELLGLVGDLTLYKRS